MIEIVKKSDCYGCGACASRCPAGSIRMVEDDEGFPYPRVDRELCTDCGACDAACPLEVKLSLPDPPEAYACKNLDARIRLESTSGGSFTALAEHVLEKGGVVYGAMFDRDFRVVHGNAMKKEDLYRFRGSKYSQSVTGNAYREAEGYLEKGVPVLFSGTPCQVAGLRSYLGREYGHLLAVDLICHGVPSPRVYREYVALLKERYREEIRKVAFRDKVRGWKMFSFSVYFTRNLYSQSKVDDLFFRGFLACSFLRPSCHTCRFKGRNRGSDITIADYWGVHTRFPEYDDDLGVALVIANTARGREAWGKAASRMDVLRSDLEHAVSHNHSYADPVPPSPGRERFFADLNALPFGEVMEKHCGDPNLRPVECGH